MRQGDIVQIKVCKWWRVVHRATHIFKAAHEIVADWRSGQVSGVWAPSDVEEVVGAQHGVIFLGITSGGQYTINWDGHLA